MTQTSKQKKNTTTPIHEIKNVQSSHILITSSCVLLVLVGISVWFLNPASITKGEAEVVIPHKQAVTREGKYVVIQLDTMSVELRDGSTVIATLPVLSQGKPGSYYETIGGIYRNDYKIPLHFSSIGHVYMPYSVHVFGNYFIHGVPYYPNGDQVSSAYSGGCIRLSNDNAKTVYTFIKEGTPIIITKDNEYSFSPTEIASTTFSSSEMTNLMVASVSLETLTQDTSIVDTDGITMTTRKTILPRLLSASDTSVSNLYARDRGEDVYIDLMNQKAEALGLTNTRFTDVTSPVSTTYEDYARFMAYITGYKSYLLSATSSAL